MSTAPAKKDAPAKDAKAKDVKAAAPAAKSKPAKAAKPARPNKTTPAKAKKASDASSAAAPRPQHSEGRLAQVLIAPIVSEKATLVSEKQNQVTFKVLRDATKPEIKAAVELMFKVDVDAVRTVLQKGRIKKFGRSMGRRDHVKKAYVSLKAGQELNFSGEGA